MSPTSTFTPSTGDLNILFARALTEPAVSDLLSTLREFPKENLFSSTASIAWRLIPWASDDTDGKDHNSDLALKITLVIAVCALMALILVTLDPTSSPDAGMITSGSISSGGSSSSGWEAISYKIE